MNLYHSKREKIDKNQSEIWTTTAWSVAIGIFPDQLLHAAVISKVSVTQIHPLLYYPTLYPISN